MLVLDVLVAMLEQVLEEELEEGQPSASELLPSTKVHLWQDQQSELSQQLASGWETAVHEPSLLETRS